MSKTSENKADPTLCKNTISMDIKKYKTILLCCLFLDKFFQEVNLIYKNNFNLGYRGKPVPI